MIGHTSAGEIVYVLRKGVGFLKFGNAGRIIRFEGEAITIDRPIEVRFGTASKSVTRKNVRIRGGRGYFTNREWRTIAPHLPAWH